MMFETQDCFHGFIIEDFSVLFDTHFSTGLIYLVSKETFRFPLDCKIILYCQEQMTVRLDCNYFLIYIKENVSFLVYLREETDT